MRSKPTGSGSPRWIAWRTPATARPSPTAHRSSRTRCWLIWSAARYQTCAPSPQAFFELLRAHTQEGLFADPLYGGNRAKLGWKVLGYPGVYLENSAEENLASEPITKGGVIQSRGAMNDNRILLATDGHIATITLNRPEKLNAIEPAMLTRLDEITSELERRDDVRVVLLTGAGERAFSVGADINAWSALQPLDMWRRWVRDGHRVFERLARLRQPLIAALNGSTFGGGLELALAADIRLATAEAEFAMPEVTIATVPGWAGTQRLPTLIGPARAKQLVFSGARIDAATAERWGLINEVVPRTELLRRAHGLAEAIAANAPVAVQIAKQLIDGTGDAAGVALEALAGALAATTDDAREGLASFRERRPPQFTGG